MDYKKIGIKKSNTLMSIIVSMLLVVGIFTGLFLYINHNAVQSGQTIDSKYNDTYNRLANSTDEIDTNIQDISDNLKNISEADNAVQVAWNGLKGLGSVLLLPVSFISSSNQLWEAISLDWDFIPPWANALIRIGILALVVLVVVSILKGDPNVIR